MHFNKTKLFFIKKRMWLHEIQVSIMRGVSVSKIKTANTKSNQRLFPHDQTFEKQTRSSND